jgi:hypothetical protein
MSRNPAEQFLEEMLPYLETLDAQIGAVIQVLEDKGITSRGELAKYVERADLASDIRDRGLRVRMERLFSLAEERKNSK